MHGYLAHERASHAKAEKQKAIHVRPGRSLSGGITR